MRRVIGGYVSCELHQAAYSFVGHPVNNDATLTLRGDVPAPFQTSQMVADSTLRHRQMRDNFSRRSRPPKQIAVTKSHSKDYISYPDIPMGSLDYLFRPRFLSGRPTYRRPEHARCVKCFVSQSR